MEKFGRVKFAKTGEVSKFTYLAFFKKGYNSNLITCITEYYEFGNIEYASINWEIRIPKFILRTLSIPHAK